MNLKFPARVSFWENVFLAQASKVLQLLWNKALYRQEAGSEFQMELL